MPLFKTQTLIFGGAFDPPHFGHRVALEDAILALEPKKTYVVPIGTNGYKKKFSYSFHERVRLCEQNFESLNCSILDIEEKENLQSTSQVLDWFRKAAPQSEEITFLMGLDQWFQIHLWKNFPEVLNQAQWAVLLRNPIDPSIKEKALKWLTQIPVDPKKVIYLDTSAPALSSTQIKTNEAKNPYDF